jgi:hypothetical protein
MIERGWKVHARNPNVLLLHFLGLTRSEESFIAVLQRRPSLPPATPAAFFGLIAWARCYLGPDGLTTCA